MYAAFKAIKYYNAASTFLIAFLIKVGILSAGRYYLAPFVYLISWHYDVNDPFSKCKSPEMLHQVTNNSFKVEILLALVISSTFKQLKEVLFLIILKQIWIKSAQNLFTYKSYCRRRCLTYLIFFPFIEDICLKWHWKFFLLDR